MFRRKTRLCAPALVLAALLVFAAGAGAETRTGEGTAVANSAFPGEADVIKATASYESSSGVVSFAVTTVSEPQPGTDAEPSELNLMTDLLTTNGTCDSSLFGSQAVFPLVQISAPYKHEGKVTAGLITAPGPGVVDLGMPTRSLTGTTTALSVTSGKIAGHAFNCAVAGVGTEGSPEPLNAVFFPIGVPAPPPPPPGGPVLSIAKAKALKLKVGKARTVRVKVTNTGATAAAQGALRVKSAPGVLVKPERQKLPVLAPGGSWTVSVRVQLTEKAKTKSTLSLTATAAGVSGKGSLVLKRKG